MEAREVKQEPSEEEEEYPCDEERDPLDIGPESGADMERLSGEMYTGNGFCPSVKEDECLEEIEIKEEVVDLEETENSKEAEKIEVTTRRTGKRSSSTPFHEVTPKTKKLKPHTQEMSQVTPEEGSQQNIKEEDKAKGSKKQSSLVILEDKVEAQLAEWLIENPILYNKGHRDYNNSVKKAMLLEEKAKSLNPPLTGEQLRWWFDTLQTRYRQLTTSKSGSGAGRVPSHRDERVLKLFSFLDTHIVGHKGGKVMKQNPAADDGNATETLQSVSTPSHVFLPTPSPASLAIPPSHPPTPTLSHHTSMSSPTESVAPLSKKDKSSRDISEDVMNLALQKLADIPQKFENNDTCAEFGKLIGLDLKNMDEKQRNLARKLIFDVVHMGNMKHLTENHHLIHVRTSN